MAPKLELYMRRMKIIEDAVQALRTSGVRKIECSTVSFRGNTKVMLEFTVPLYSPEPKV